MNYKKTDRQLNEIRKTMHKKHHEKFDRETVTIKNNFFSIESFKSRLDDA